MNGMEPPMPASTGSAPHASAIACLASVAPQPVASTRSPVGRIAAEMPELVARSCGRPLSTLRNAALPILCAALAVVVGVPAAGEAAR